MQGVSDRSFNTDQVTLRIPSQPGFTYRCLLDGAPVPTDLNVTVNQMDYHELSVTRIHLASGAVSNRLVRFIVVSAQRGEPERGLPAWLPFPPIDSTDAEFAGTRLRVTTPREYPLGLPIPVIAWVDDGEGRERRANGVMTAPGWEAHPVRIRRGVGSALLPAATEPGELAYNAELRSLRAFREITVEAATTWVRMSGVLKGTNAWPENSRIQITGDMDIASGATLTIGAGSVIKLNPLVNITNSGRLLINGTLDRPVVFTATNRVAPERPAGAWGGLILRGSGAQLVANAAILAGGGGDTDFDFSPGSSHRPEQAVLLLQSGARAFLTNCCILDTAGQVGNGYNSDLTLDYCLFQRAITAGEYVGGTIIINHSALLEFPADDGVVNASIARADYDGIYFTTGTHILMNSLLGFAKDDAIDSGSGGAGTMLVTNCWIESALHEAQAWSGEGRITETYDTVVMNSGQGIEAGYSTGNNSPRCFAERLLSLGNAVGARFGDNYDWTYNGFLRLTNCLLLFNVRDAWGLNWQSGASGWIYRTNQMDLRSNFLSAPNPHHPSNTVWDPARDAARLAAFMTPPPDAPVGLGFAVWTNQFDLASLPQGVPVRLSHFTTNFVSVGYAFESDGSVLAEGRLTFAPGETVKSALPAGFDLQNRHSIRVVLKSPIRGELTGVTNVTFQGTVARPQLSLGVATNQLPGYRLAEGQLLRLSAPTPRPVSVDYAYEASGTVLQAGTLVLPPLESWREILLTNANPSDHTLIRFSLSNPSGANLTGLTTVYYVRTVAVPESTNPVLVPRGAVWRVRDAPSDPGAAWRTLDFDDAGWRSGRAQLGFGENDEATLVASNRQSTTYFRHAFQVLDPSVFTNLSLWLLRDDAGVVHLNGAEVFRSPNLPASPTAISYSTLATSNGENTIDTNTIGRAALRAGTNVVAVEIHQGALDSSDVSFDFELAGRLMPGPAQPTPLYVGRFGPQIVAAWAEAGFLLEQAEQIVGPWTVWTNASPALAAPAGSNRFYRLRR